MKEKKYNYVYAVINFEQKLAYIGSRGSNTPPMEDPYMGSFRKDSTFKPTKKIVLSAHQTRREAYEAEQIWQIKFDVAKSSLFVNRGILTSSGFSNAGRTGYVGSMRGKKHSEQAKKKIRSRMKHRFKSINVKRISTSEVLKFDSIGQAARELSISNTQLSFLLQGKYKRTHDYCLETTDLGVFQSNFVLKNVITGELIEGETQTELAQKIGSTSGSISRVFEGKRLSTKGYCLPETDSSLVSLRKPLIKLFNIVTNKIEFFKGATEAARKIGVSHSLVSMVLSGKRKKAGAYILPPECLNSFNQNTHKSHCETDPEPGLCALH